MRKMILLASAVFAMLALATVASAAWVTAPTSVIAQESGHYVVVMGVHTGSNEVVSISTEALLGLENSSEERVRDLNCDVEIPAGSAYTFVWEGNLDDPDLEGLVEMSINFCDQTSMSANIVILPFGTVDSEVGTLGSIKALYR